MDWLSHKKKKEKRNTVLNNLTSSHSSCLQSHVPASGGGWTWCSLFLIWQYLDPKDHVLYILLFSIYQDKRLFCEFFCAQTLISVLHQARVLCPVGNITGNFTSDTPSLIIAKQCWLADASWLIRNTQQSLCSDEVYTIRKTCSSFF